MICGKNYNNRMFTKLKLTCPFPGLKLKTSSITKENAMKKVISLLLISIMLLTLCACGKEPEAEVVVVTEVPIMAEPVNSTPEPTPEATPEPTPIPIQPELPPVNDAALNHILDSIVSNVKPGSSGTSLRAAQCAGALLDWGMVTKLNDDEIYSAVGCWLDEQSDENLLIFFESFYSVYTASYDLRAENGESLMRDAGISSGNYPWNDQAAHAVEMVYYGSGLR
jgi:hypothetical protein